MEPWNESLTEDWVEPLDLQAEEDTSSGSVLREQNASRRNTIGRQLSIRKVVESPENPESACGTVRNANFLENSQHGASSRSTNVQLEESSLIRCAPDWRQRLLNGNQTDLFSPTNLEALSRGAPVSPQVTPDLQRPTSKPVQNAPTRVFTGVGNASNSRFSPQISRVGWRPPVVADGSSLSIIQTRPSANGTDSLNEEMSEILVNHTSRIEEVEGDGNGDSSEISSDRSSANLREFLDQTTRVVELIRGERSFSMDPVSLQYTSPPSFHSSNSLLPPITSLVIQAASPSPGASLLSQVPSTPVQSHLVQQPPSVFALKTLQEFSVNQTDASAILENQRGESRSEPALSSDLISTFHLATQQLVKNLTDFEPYEPYWQTLKDVQLNSTRLITLHNLDQFCGKIERLDVSQNEISQLHGVPATVRHLNIAQNCLTNLSAWAHLSNLQFIDVSNNQLESLNGFESLVHLRELRANSNKIRSIVGISHLDGLNVLKLNDNCLDQINFEGTGLIRLVQLDLRQNQLRQIDNLQALPELLRLDLACNNLDEFKISHNESPRKLQTLILLSNFLTELNVSHIPELRILEADQNKLVQVDGLETLDHLKTISVRSQLSKDDSQSQEVLLRNCFEVHQLQASKNFFPQFLPQKRFLNLQKLELTQCGLQSLPGDFGQKMSNLRSLNLNFNSIDNIDSLVGIARLQNLFIAGNRLQRLRRTVKILGTFAKSLRQLDMRDNLFNFGFFPPRNEHRLLQNTSSPMLIATKLEFLLPETNDEANRLHRARLDRETAFQMRRYHVLLAQGCGILYDLDGSAIDRAAVFTKDETWMELVAAGVVASDTNSNQDYNGEESSVHNNNSSSLNQQSNDSIRICQSQSDISVVRASTTGKDDQPQGLQINDTIKQPTEALDTVRQGTAILKNKLFSVNVSKKRPRPASSTATNQTVDSVIVRKKDATPPVASHTEPANQTASQGERKKRQQEPDEISTAEEVESPRSATSAPEEGLAPTPGLSDDISQSESYSSSDLGEIQSISELTFETSISKLRRHHAPNTEYSSDQSSLIEQTAKLSICRKTVVSAGSIASSQHGAKSKKLVVSRSNREAEQSRRRQAHLSKMRASLAVLSFDGIQASGSYHRSSDSTSLPDLSIPLPGQDDSRETSDTQSRMTRLHQQAVKALREGEEKERKISNVQPVKRYSRHEAKRLVNIRRREVSWTANEAGIKE